MKQEIELYELIEQYLLGKLKGEDLQKIEDRIANNAEFAAEVKKHSEFHAFIFERAMIDMKAEISKIHQYNTTGWRNLGWRNLFSFLGAIVFIAIVFLAFNPKIKYDKGLISGNFQKRSGVIAVDSPAIATAPINFKTKSNKEQLYTASNSVSIADTTIAENDTVYYSQEQTGLELSEIINSAVSVSQPEIQSKTKNMAGAEKTEPQAGIKAVSDCDEVNIEADIFSENSCDNKANGKIKVDKQSITGGEAPYLISIDEGKNYYPDYIINNLSASKYTLFIRDANNCIGKLGSVIIKSVDCSNEYVFAPDKGEVWEIPTGDFSGDLKIYNKQGKIIYSADFKSPGDYEWDGRTNNGSELPMGAYMFILKLSNSEIIRGNVTIVR